MSLNTSPNLASNLRHFRFQKKPSISSIDLNGSTSSDHSPMVFGRRGTRVIESEDEKSPVKAGYNEGLRGLVAQFPSVDALVVEKCLVECQGDVLRARNIIKNSGSIHQAQTNGAFENGNSFPKRKLIPDAEEQKYRKIKRVRHDSDEYSGSDTDQNAYSKEQNPVFDSDDDSDVEVSNNTTVEQSGVLEFLSNGTLGELLCMPQISKKKADAIIELRPFDGWRDMVEKFQQTKGLGGEILNSAQDYLYKRHVVTQLMNKCSKLSSELERMNFMGHSYVSRKPSLLSEELTLADYQMIGLNWLVMLQNRGLNGILADEMGLGKTVQVIAFLANLKETSGDDSEPNLIVVPSSTLDNWTNELERWCPGLKVLVYYGDKEERKSIRCSKLAQGNVKEYDVVLTTYNLITASPEEKKMFKVLKFLYVVFDEAHMLKNMKTARYEQLSRINASRRILLTGTPLQNDLLELMSLLTFVMPEMFQNKKEYLKCLFTRTVTKDKNENAQEAAAPQELPKFEQEQVANAKKIMKPFVLRRLKKDVLKDLPTKTDIIKHCPMSERQRIIYDSLVQTYAKSASEEKTEETMAGLTMMMQLRKAANHPLLVRDLYTNEKTNEIAKILAKKTSYKEKNLAYVQEDLTILSDFELHSLCESYPILGPYMLTDDQILDSGKFKWMDQLLPDLIKSGHRLLIFSQFVIMLDVIESYMNIRGHQYLRFDGSTAVPVRQELIDQFNRDPNIPVFLLSTRAGGLGINLTAADHVIIHDLDFNPYNDKQAEDRCHRVGQTKPVTVYRVVSDSSIEEDILQIATGKLHLEREISAGDAEVSEVKQQMLLKRVLGLDQMSPQKRTV